MTNEVAIKILQKLYEGCNKHKNTDLIKEAYNMAIEALKAQDATDTNVGSNDDTIYRQMAIDIFDDYNVSVENGELEAYSRDRKRLCDLPSAQPERKTGKWMDDLISRQDVEQTVEDNILLYTHSDRPIDQDPDTECHRAIRTALRMLRKDLRKLPSAQPEIIRCKDCKHIDEDGVCQNSKGLAIQDDDDYCSYAERRTDGNGRD